MAQSSLAVQKALWVSEDDGNSFSRANFPVDHVWHALIHWSQYYMSLFQSTTVESHYTLVDAADGAALVAVEHNNFFKSSDFYLYYVSPASLSKLSLSLNQDALPCLSDIS